MGMRILSIIVLVLVLFIPRAVLSYDCSDWHPGWLFCDDFERGNDGDDLDDAGNGFPWRYTQNLKPGSWANHVCDDGSNGWCQISTDEAYSGTRSAEFYQCDRSTNEFGRAHLHYDSGDAIWNGFDEQEEIYVQFKVKYEAGSDLSDSDNKHHLCILSAGAYTSPTTSDYNVYIDYTATKRFDLIFHAANQTSGDLEIEGVSFNGTDYVGSSYSTYPAVWSDPGAFSTDTWYRIELWVLMNTFTGGVPNSDGELKLWIEGTMYAHHTNMIFRDGSHQSIKWNHWFFGPNSNWDAANHPNHNQSIWVDDNIISTIYIGSYESEDGSTYYNYTGSVLSGGSMR